MEQLVKSTAAYKILCNEAREGRVAHAYMLLFADSANMRAALKIFAGVIFGCSGDSELKGKFERDNCIDCKYLPSADKKISADMVKDIISDSALRPAEGDRKLYVISGFEDSSEVVQNKLLKILEEPPEGVYFLLGATSGEPVLPTVKSRVHMLEIPPFTPDEIYQALERERRGGEYNRMAAESCGGILGTAQLLAGGAYGKIREAAMELCCADTLEKAGEISLKYGDSRLKKQIVAEAERLFFSALRSTVTGRAGEDEKKICGIWDSRTLAYAAESYGRAQADIKFNAYYSALIYSLMAGVIQENNKWQKL